jgi:hypothetical protein
MKLETLEIKFSSSINSEKLRSTICFLTINGKGCFGSTKQSPKDKDDKLIGKKKALERALKRTGLSKKGRTVVWQQFFKSCLTKKQAKRMEGKS